VPCHKKDLPRGTVFEILKQAGISREEIKDLQEPHHRLMQYDLSVVNRKIPYNLPYPGGRELEGGGNSPSPNLSLQGRGIL